ncbi:MAG: hypothetical protein KDD67_11340 [Ignavibacteriae bacterium]|nr:hypothetical protein [Ignavibacteriota bacterium]MCB9215881.1 hypothetical protein [Ignavibacteria bacterium]
MGRTEVFQSVLLSTVLFCALAFVPLNAQDYSTMKPLDGYDFLSVSGSLLPTVASIDPGVIPTPNESFRFGTPSGSGHELGISWSRLLPKLFVRSSTTFDLRLSWLRISQEFSARGRLEELGDNGKLIEREVRQTTVGSGDVIALGGRFSFDTRQMKQMTPTIIVGGTVGHIVNIKYQTTFDSGANIPVSELGLPLTGPTPDRRYLFGALHLGFGGRFNFGVPSQSVALVPEVELQIPVTSLLKVADWIPFGIRFGLALRVPLSPL